MKRRELVRLLEANGWHLLRHGSSHDIYTNGTQSEAIPRHAEIKENLAKSILRKLKLK